MFNSSEYTVVTDVKYIVPKDNSSIAVFSDEPFDYVTEDNVLQFEDNVLQFTGFVALIGVLTCIGVLTFYRISRPVRYEKVTFTTEPLYIESPDTPPKYDQDV
tara:strand:+ start:607 stop:915 length:309 start_codon:yes stop_codon:yes gene_type:complete